jgi:predicted sulfurtransferase
MSQTGKPLSPQEWHNALSAPSSPGEKPARIFDCRNEFENEVGHFQGATPLPTQRFIETFDAMQELLQGSSQDDNIYIYCTGGIRCEKVGAWLTQVKKYKVPVPSSLVPIASF